MAVGLYVRELVMPQNVSVEKVSAETQPYKLATYIEKACCMASQPTPT